MDAAVSAGNSTGTAWPLAASTSTRAPAAR